ncbi:MAG: carboxypeptidase M32 [Clostridia bacterium]|nr:carboxypeptidase M32 [Clostridia bacterium]
MQQALKIYNDTNKKIKALSFSGFLIGWDMQTEMPAKSNHGEQMATLSEMEYTLSTSPEYVNAINVLYQNLNELNDLLKHEIIVAKEGIDKLTKIPMEEYVAFSALTNDFYNVYVTAKQTDNFELALPYYKKIIEYRKKYVDWLKTDKLCGYNVLLDEFEKGLTEQKYDQFFNLLRKKLVPVIKQISKVSKNQKNKFAWAYQKFDVDGQKKFQEYLRDVFGFNRDYTVIKESEHPFTTNCTVTDVRITNHFYEDNFVSSIFSAIHEMGHGLYELQISPEIDKTMSGGGASMAMHESQSRFMENMIARSLAFWQTHFYKLKEIFPNQLANVTAEDMYEYVNLVECSLIRTEADELTYGMHVMVRYELEKAILSGKVNAENIPEKWNELYKEYLGVTVPSYSSGCLQDVHWAYGEFGYFPTYALGSAYAAQIYNAMQRDIDIDAEIRTGKIEKIAKWLKDNIHTYGSSKYSSEILKLATNEDFNPDYYCNYLVNKYTKIYNLK